MPKYRCKVHFPNSIRDGKWLDNRPFEAGDSEAAHIRVLMELGVDVTEVPEVPEVDFHKAFAKRVSELYRSVFPILGPPVSGVKVVTPVCCGKTCVSYRGIIMFFNADGSPAE